VWPDDRVERPRPQPPPAAAQAAAPPSDGRAPADPADLVFAWAPFPVEFGPAWWLDAPGKELEPEPEPNLVFAWAPFPVEFGASWWLDPDRAAAAEQQSPPAGERTQPFGLLGSLAVHLLPLIVLLGWARTPAGTSGAIPVQLVLEEPRTASVTTPPAERPAAPDNGGTLPQARDVPVETPAAARAQPPDEAAVPPPPVPPPPAKPAPPPRPVPPPTAQKQPQPAPRPPPQPHLAAAAATAPPAQLEHARSTPGPDASQGDYFAYLVTLTRRHTDLLPLSFLAGRRGETVLSVIVLGDGTIAQISVKRSSGYPDIDARIQQMVAAVGRFPPPPQRYQGSTLDMDFRLAFPNGLQER
jgi:TonB family protein